MEHNEIIKYNNNIQNILSIPLILNQIFLFLEKDNIKYLSLCNKKIYQLFCSQVKILKICKNFKLNISSLIYK